MALGLELSRGLSQRGRVQQQPIGEVDRCGIPKQVESKCEVIVADAHEEREGGRGDIEEDEHPRPRRELREQLHVRVDHLRQEARDVPGASAYKWHEAVGTGLHAEQGRRQRRPRSRAKAVRV